ncbi:polysaccharide biosynthesis C-terminal domain-containing protein [uncultured Slackia sp.]|uniref:polysaccharide biosynthesis C-terminal domain-containing protein n=1 Tax=uncultured Slackia sp. TaxID=665903 RepID=UPI002621B8D7|nr:polysaccharide biosynthesis C-terminal domain-containing protein [uncultured Slackia sp.]
MKILLNNQNSPSQMKLGAAISYTTVAFNALAGLIYTPWMISCIGADNYGLYTLALSVVNFFLMDFGLSNAVSRFMSKYYAEGKGDFVSAFLGMTYKAYLIIDCVICVVLLAIFFNIDFLYSNLSAGQLTVFKGLFLVIALYSVLSFPLIPLNGILVSNERFVALNTCELLQKVSNVLLIVAALLLGADVFALVAVNASTGLLFALVKYAYVRVRTKSRASMKAWDKSLLNEIVCFSGWVTLAQVCQRMIFSIMPSIIAMMSCASEVALFGLASSLEGYVYSVANVLNGMFMPKVSRALASPDKDELQRIASRYGRIQLFVVGLLIIGFICAGKEFVSCWMGDKYLILWECTLLLIAPGLIELPQLVANTAIVASNQVKYKAYIFLVMAMVNLLFGILLSGQFGALGACISICVAYCFRTLGLNVVYAKKLGIDLKRFFHEVYSRWIPAAVLTVVVGLVAHSFMPLYGWLSFFVEAAVIILVYAILIWFLTFNSYEKNLMLSIFRRKK